MRLTIRRPPEAENAGWIRSRRRYPPRVKLRWWLLLLVLVGLAARVAAVRWNELPHGDVHLDLLTLESWGRGEGLRTPLERSVDLYPRVDDAPGYPADQHPPLAILLASIVRPFVEDAYDALRLTSLACGLLLLVLLGLVARRMADPWAARVVVALGAASFLLSDFAGNGSIYTQHALFGLVALLALLGPGVGRAFLGGVALGLAYLTNHQALALMPAALLATVLAGWGRPGRGLRDAAAIGAGFVLAVAPWWWRNLQVFGDPFFSVNPLYLRWRMGATASLVEAGDRLRLVLDGPDLGTLVENLARNLVVNVRFVALQAPLWMTTVLGAAVIGARSAWRRGRTEGDRGALVLIAFASFHLLSMLLWPACKFRYFVPLLPLVLVLAGRALWSDVGRTDRWWLRLVGLGLVLVAIERMLRGSAIDGMILLIAAAASIVPWLRRSGRPIGAAAVIVPFVAAQVVLFAASGTRTTYYDAILAPDPFGKHGTEAADRRVQAELSRAAGGLRGLPLEAVVAPIELKSYLLEQGSRIRVVQPSPIEDERVWDAIGRRFGNVSVVRPRDDLPRVSKFDWHLERLLPPDDGGSQGFVLLRRAR